MPFCPKCRDEYEPGITQCKECDVALVGTLDEAQPAVEDLEAVCSLTQEAQAYIVRGYLESEGIPCVLENASFHAGPAPSTSLTKVRLWVKKTDAQRARTLINIHEDFLFCAACGHVANARDVFCDFCGEEFED